MRRGSTADSKRRIILTDMEIVPSLRSVLEEIQRNGFEVRRIGSIDADQFGNVEVLLLRDSSLVNKKLFNDFPKVKLFQSMSAGVDFINIASIPHGVVLCSNAGAFKEPIAEHVFAMILFFTKNLARNHNRLRDGEFNNAPDAKFLAGKTIGVVGAGGIGQSVARIAKAFNMRTIGINTSGTSAPNFDEVKKIRDLDSLLKQADFVVISIPLNIHTRNLVDSRRLKLMKEDAVLVNVARGPIISQEALYKHLKQHPRFCAGIDVWWSYPKTGEKFQLDFPFFELQNFLASPHVADGVPESTEAGQIRAFENIVRYSRNEPLERIIDKSDYKGFTGAHH